MRHQHYCDENGQLELVPGTLRGYRCWGWDLFGKSLVSTGWCYRWRQNPQQDARCMHLESSSEMCKPVHVSPVQWCSCGYYASYDPGDCVRHANTGFARLPGLVIQGAISAHGRIVLGTEGFRAQYVKIDALWGGTEAIDAAQSYGVPWFQSEKEMLEKFPPSDVTELVGRPHPLR